MATIRDVARLAGVSAGTVSNVLNRPSYVSASTRERVERAIRELDFVPQQEARQFRPGRVRTLGMAMADMSNPFFVDVALGAESRAKEHGVGIVFCNNGFDPVREVQTLDLLVQLRVQGIMITPVDERNPRLNELMARGVPIVLVDRVSHERSCCTIVTDDATGGRLAAEHLLERGYRDVAFVGSPALSSKVAERLRGAQEYFTAHGAGAIEVLETGAWTVESGRRAGVDIAARPDAERPRAVFCANDVTALGFLQEMVGAGIRVPEDIAIIGYDDLIWAETAAVPLTTVRQPREELGRLSVDLILAELNTGAEHVHDQHLVLTPTLVVRQSS